jgi:hypothetical protein
LNNLKSLRMMIRKKYNVCMFKYNKDDPLN